MFGQIRPTVVSRGKEDHHGGLARVPVKRGDILSLIDDKSSPDARGPFWTSVTRSQGVGFP